MGNQVLSSQTVMEILQFELDAGGDSPGFEVGMVITMNRDEIFAVIQKNVLDILFELDPSAVTPEGNLTDLGANSLDRADIVTQSMEDLNLNIPLVELGKVKDIPGLIGLFDSKLN